MMRALPALACVLAAALAGCGAPTGDPSAGDPSAFGSCATQPLSAGSASGSPIRVYVGSEVDRPACLHLSFDGQEILVIALDAAEPTGEYREVGSLRWEGASLLARATESGRSEEARLTLGDENHVIVSVFEGSLRIQNVPDEPAFG